VAAVVTHQQDSATQTHLVLLHSGHAFIVIADMLLSAVCGVLCVAGVLPGQVMLQNLPSVVAGVVLSPPPGSRVLDMCAAPGGGTPAGHMPSMGAQHDGLGVTRFLLVLGIHLG
jgi:hypothetical protein